MCTACLTHKRVTCEEVPTSTCSIFDLANDQKQHILGPFASPLQPVTHASGCIHMRHPQQCATGGIGYTKQATGPGQTCAAPGVPQLCTSIVHSDQRPSPGKPAAAGTTLTSTLQRPLLAVSAACSIRQNRPNPSRCSWVGRPTSTPHTLMALPTAAAAVAAAVRAAVRHCCCCCWPHCCQPQQCCCCC